MSLKNKITQLYEDIIYKIDYYYASKLLIICFGTHILSRHLESKAGSVTIKHFTKSVQRTKKVR